MVHRMTGTINLLILASFIPLSQSLGVEEKVSYSGYSVLRTVDQENSAIKTLQQSLQVWEVVSNDTKFLDILVKPDLKAMVEQILKCANTSYSVLISDLQQSINQENVEVEPTARFRSVCGTSTGMSWSKYQPYDTISRYMDCLSTQYGNIAQLFNIGISSEGRALKVLQIGNGGRGSRKQAVWIDGGIHAREWISPATVSYIMMELVENTHQYRELLEKYDFFVMPSVNPDGYEYSRNYNRMWRKTRSQNYGSSCRGVDPNRNFGYQWGGAGTSTDPCSDIYKGTHAFSEPETAAVRDFILARSRNLKMYLTFHSYGQMVLYPWGYARRNHDDENELYRVGAVGNRAMGNTYTVGSAAKVLYPAAGGSDDWAKGGAGIRYSYTIELPDTGAHGFILPANKIASVARQALNAVISMTESL